MKRYNRGSGVQLFGIGHGKFTLKATAVLSLNVTIRPGSFNPLTMFGLIGQFASVAVTDGVGGAVVYTATVNLGASAVLDGYDFFFARFDQLAEFAFVDIPTGRDHDADRR